MSNKFKEVEYKYDAKNISLTSFQELMIKMQPTKLIETGSWDLYFTNKKDEFIRYRQSEIKPELTIKRKVKKENNTERIEVNIGLSMASKYEGVGEQEESVRAFTKLLEYDFNFKIYKTCFIYFFDDVDVVYYIVYDENMKEQQRFIEIEYLEEKAHSSSMADIVKSLKKYEASLHSLGISSDKRLSKSLFETFKKTL